MTMCVFLSIMFSDSLECKLVILVTSVTSKISIEIMIIRVCPPGHNVGATQYFVLSAEYYLDWICKILISISCLKFRKFSMVKVLNSEPVSSVHHISVHLNFKQFFRSLRILFFEKFSSSKWSSLQTSEVSSVGEYLKFVVSYKGFVI